MSLIVVELILEIWFSCGDFRWFFHTGVWFHLFVFEENQIGDSSPCSAAHPFLQLGHRLYVFIPIKKE